LIKWLHKNGETHIDGFDFKKLPRLDKGNDAIRRATLTNDEYERLYRAMCTYCAKHNKLDELFDELWPITRSITGPGITKSLEIISEQIPLEVKKVPTGTSVFDWVVPPEWELISATLYTEDGEKILSTDDSNMHVLNFSSDQIHQLPMGIRITINVSLGRLEIRVSS